jgi:hypothetical protein
MPKSRDEHRGEWADQLRGLNGYKYRYCRELRQMEGGRTILAIIQYPSV